MFRNQMLRMGEDEKCALITKQWTFNMLCRERSKGEKERAPEKGEGVLPTAHL